MDELDQIFGMAVARGGEKAEVPTPVNTLPSASSVMSDRVAEQVPTTPQMSHLAAFVIKTFSTNANHRRSSGVDDRLRYCIQAQTCEYSQLQQQKMAAAGIDKRVFAPITATKNRAAKAMLTEIFGSASDKPWTLSATPDPEAPQKIEEAAYAETELEAVLAMQRLSQMGVQELPPEQAVLLVQTLVKKMSDRYDRIANERKTFARNRAKRLETKIHDMMIQGGWIKAFNEYVDYICTYGTGLIIGPVPRVIPVNKIKSTKDGVKYVREYGLALTWEAVNPMDAYPAPGAKDVEDGPLCIRVRYNPSDLRQYADKVGAHDRSAASGWIPETLKAMLDFYPMGGMKLNDELYDQSRRDAERGGPDSPDDRAIEGIRCFASVRGSMLQQMGIFKTREGKQINYADYYRTETIVLGGFVVYCRIIDDRMGLPVSKGIFYEIPGSWWGEAIADKLYLVQNTMNNAIKSLMQNMAAASGPMYWMRDVAQVVDKDGSGLKIKPHKMWFFQASMTGNSGAPIGTIQVPSNATELLGVWEKMKLQADDDSGIPAYTYGQSAGQGGALRTSSGLQIFTEAASRGMKMVVSTTDRLVTRDQVHKTAVWYLLYGEDPDLKGDCEVNPDGVMGKILRAQQEQQRIQLLNVVMKDQEIKQLVGVKGLVALLRPSLRDIDVNPDDVLPSDERIAELEMMQKIQQLYAATNARLSTEQNAAQVAATQGGAGEGQPPPVEQPTEPAPFSVAERRNAA